MHSFRLLAAALLAALLSPVVFAASNTDSLPEQVTWAEQIAPLVYENCASCHRPGDIAPMSLLTYDDARPWAKSIQRVVADGTMPPWHADARYGEFANDRSLTEHEVALIERWVQQNAREGDPSKAPAPPEFEDGWRLGEPDLVLTFDPISLPAGGPDVFHDLVVATDLEQDRWLRAVEIKAGNRKVLHHVILYATDGNGPPSSGWLGAWAAGMDPMVFPEGTAKLVQSGSKIVGDMHYHPDSEPSEDQTRVGLYFYDGEPEKELINLWVQNSSFEIPAGVADHEVTASHTFDQDATVYGLLPHMHYRGDRFTYRATFPDGRTETLLHVDDYDFNWQTLYQLAEPLKMPAGSRIDCEAHFDNSTDNPDNPDPTRAVTFGNESYDEMMIGFVDYVVDEGQRPPAPDEVIAARLEELGTDHPGEVWDVVVTAPGGMELRTALHLAGEGDGVWHIPMNGQVVTGALSDIVRDGGSLTATLTAAFGVMAVTGEVTDDQITGSVSVGDQSLPFAGQLHRVP